MGHLAKVLDRVGIEVDDDEVGSTGASQESRQLLRLGELGYDGDPVRSKERRHLLAIRRVGIHDHTVKLQEHDCPRVSHDIRTPKVASSGHHPRR
jgi:hypothetical protein